MTKQKVAQEDAPNTCGKAIMWPPAKSKDCDKITVRQQGGAKRKSTLNVQLFSIPPLNNLGEPGALIDPPKQIYLQPQSIMWQK